MATPVEIVTAYIAEIQGSADNQTVQIGILQTQIEAAQDAKAIYDCQIGALAELKRRLEANM